MSVTRREVLLLVPALALVPRRGPQSPGGSEAEVASASASDALRSPVVSFHLDQPYLDLTGLEKPYIPPAGMRSGAPLAALREEEILSRFYGFI
jgi:hypothetical protein